MAKPNWAEWRDIPTAALWEVCALSLDIEPRTLKRYVEPYRNRDIILFEPFSDDETEKEFYRRCKILHANLNEPPFTTQYERPKNSDEVNIGAYVRICEFLTWVRQKEWSLPPELILPNTNQTHRSKTQKSAMDWQTEARLVFSTVDADRKLTRWSILDRRQQYCCQLRCGYSLINISRLIMQLYYLPGRGGRLGTGLGEALTARGLSVSGRETVGEFARLSFQEQIELVAQDLKTDFWHKDSRVIANSYGAYLFLHAQTLLPAYVGRVLLLSPIVGEFSSGETATHFVPPRSRQLMKLAQGNR